MLEIDTKASGEHVASIFRVKLGGDEVIQAKKVVIRDPKERGEETEAHPGQNE
jgi:hypothetical protein